MTKLSICLVILALCLSLVTSEEPELEPEAPAVFVHELTENDFYDFVLDSTKNVMVEFYSDVTTWSRNYVAAYEKIAEVFKDENNCVVAKVNVNKYRQLGRIYEWGAFMKFWFFPADSRSDGELYEGGRSIPDMVKFLNEKCGTNRMTDGKLDVTSGRLQRFDILANSFINNVIKFTPTNNNNNNNNNNNDTETGTYYTHVMKKIMEKGVGYLDEESNRLSNILEGYMKRDMRKKTTTRINILKYFHRLIHGVEDEVVEDEVEGEASDDVTKNTTTEDQPVKSADDLIMGVLAGGPTHGTIDKEVVEKGQKKEL